MISAIDNLKIKKYLKLKDKKFRLKHKLFLLENPILIKEALEAGLVNEILTTNSDLEGTLVSHAILKKFMQNGVRVYEQVAICKMKEAQKLTSDHVLALNYIQNPGNAGAALRSALSFGYNDVLIEGVDLYHYKVLEASKGAFFKINVIQTNDLTKYFQKYQVIGAYPNVENAISCYEFVPQQKHIVVVGNEGHGISDQVSSFIDQKIYIPINFESLNVTIAASIIMSYFSKLK